MRSNSSPNGGRTVVSKLRIDEGGTGASSPEEARDKLGLVGLDEINQSGGVAGLDENGRFPISLMPSDGPSPYSVSGATSVVRNSTNSYSITNYDISETYVVTASVGTVSIKDNDITYIAPATGTSGGFTLNGRSIALTLTA